METNDDSRSDLFQPQSLDNVFHNPKAISQLLHWFRSDDETNAAALWIYGPPGCGKSTVLYLAAKACGIDLPIVGSSQEGDLLSQLGLASPVQYIVVRDEGFVALDSLDAKSIRVIVLSHQRPSRRSLNTLVIPFRRPKLEDTVSFLKDHWQPMGMAPTKKELRCIVRSLHCDIRRIAHWVGFYQNTFAKGTQGNPQEQCTARRRRKKYCGRPGTMRSPMEELAEFKDSRSSFDAGFSSRPEVAEEYAAWLVVS